MTPSDRRWSLIPTARPGVPAYSEDLLLRAEQVLSGTSLAEVILYSHLLVERALDLWIQARFAQPDVLVNRRLARLGFAQKITVYVGLYAPDEYRVELLQALNRLRNRMAHTLTDLNEATLQCLPDRVMAIPLGPDIADGTALRRVQDLFLWLALAEFQAIGGVHLLDRNVGILSPSCVPTAAIMRNFRSVVYLGDPRQLPPGRSADAAGTTANS